MPFQSTIDRSVGKLIKSFRNRDYFGANRLNSVWKTNRVPENYINVPTAVTPSGKWDLSKQGNCIFKLGEGKEDSLPSSSSSSNSVKVNSSSPIPYSILNSISIQFEPIS